MAAPAHEPLDLNDEVLDMKEAADFLGNVSESWLRRSDVPRARIGTRVVFLKSQLILYAAVRLTHRIQ